MPVDVKAKSRSTRAGIIFPVGRIHRHLKEGRYAERISSDAPVYLAAVLESVIDEVFKEALNQRDKKSTKRITPNNIVNAIRKDKELNEIFKDVVIRDGGVARFDEEKKHIRQSKKSQDQ